MTAREEPPIEVYVDVPPYSTQQKGLIWLLQKYGAAIPLLKFLTWVMLSSALVFLHPNLPSEVGWWLLLLSLGLVAGVQGVVAAACRLHKHFNPAPETPYSLRATHRLAERLPQHCRFDIQCEVERAVMARPLGQGLPIATQVRLEERIYAELKDGRDTKRS